MAHCCTQHKLDRIKIGHDGCRRTTELPYFASVHHPQGGVDRAAHSAPHPVQEWDQSWSGEPRLGLFQAQNTRCPLPFNASATAFSAASASLRVENGPMPFIVRLRCCELPARFVSGEAAFGGVGALHCTWSGADHHDGRSHISLVGLFLAVSVSCPFLPHSLHFGEGFFTRFLEFRSVRPHKLPEKDARGSDMCRVASDGYSLTYENPVSVPAVFGQVQPTADRQIPRSIRRLSPIRP